MERLDVRRDNNVTHVTMLDPCFTPDLLRDLKGFRPTKFCEVVYFYGVDRFTWQLGGDLALVADAAERRDVDALTDYAMLCCEALVVLTQHPCTTVARVSGDVFGGGFEAAMACDEIQTLPGLTTRIAFPEYKMGFWPGMGGQQLLRARALGDLLDDLRSGDPMDFPGHRYDRTGRVYLDTRALYADALRWAFELSAASGRTIKAMRAAARMQRRKRHANV